MAPLKTILTELGTTRPGTVVISETLALGETVMPEPLGEVSWGFHVMLEHVIYNIHSKMSVNTVAGRILHHRKDA